jgi:hypothetical protein
LMRTVEVLFVIIIILGAFIVATQFAVLPSPRQIFGTNLRELAVSTLQTFDAKYNLSRIAFKDASDPAWGALQKALSASLPPSIVFNLTVFSINSTGGVVTYNLENSISNAEGDLGVGSESASCLVTSSEVTFGITPEKIGAEDEPITLYILNCNDANGWWITGYTGQSLALDLHNLLSPYFQTTILVNSTDELGLLLDGTLLTNPAITGERIQDAVVINTFGEAVPIPSDYCEEGYQGGSYAKYFNTLGQKVDENDWTWVSIIGYPFYYVSNTGEFTGNQAWGIYGTVSVGPPGLNAFLQGINGWGYSYDGSGKTRSIGVVHLSSEALDLCNYYGIYPSYQSSSRALDEDILYYYNLDATEIFNRPSSDPDYIAAATYSHQNGGAFVSIGLSRVPDIRVTALALLMYYRPQIYRSEFGASGTSMLVTLQLGQQGGT